MHSGDPFGGVGPAGTLGKAPRVGERHQSRYKVFWRAQLSLPGSGACVEALVTDIAEGGLGVAIDACVRPETLVGVKLRVPDPNGGAALRYDACGSARVAFSILQGNRFQTGLQWLECSAAVHQLLSAWMRKLPRAA
jgi:hypothetical protein